MLGDGRANRLHFRMRGGIAALLPAVDAGGKLVAGGVVKHRSYRDVSRGCLACHLERATHARLGAGQALGFKQ